MELYVREWEGLKMDLDQQLEKILLESGIDFELAAFYEIIDREYSCYSIQNKVNSIWDTIPEGAKIGIYGKVLHLYSLFKVVDFRCKNIVVLATDEPTQDTLFGYPLVSEKELLNYNVDVVFLVTPGYDKYLNRDVNIINMFEEFSDTGITADFYFQSRDELYYQIHIAYQLYKKSKDSKHLKNLIRLYLNIRDFVYVFRFIDLYINNKYPYFEKFIELKKQLKQFLRDIKSHLAETDTKPIVLMVLDAFRYRDVDEKKMPFLNQIADDNMRFEKVYTNVPHTRGSFLSMFTGKKYFDDELYIQNELPEESTLTDLERRGKSFRYYGSYFLRFFPEKLTSSKRNLCLSLIMWNYICDLYDKSATDISVLHFMETHTPYISAGVSECGMIKDYDIFYLCEEEEVENVYNQYLESLRYIDRQFEFYFPFFIEQSTTLICSDHGSIFKKDALNLLPQNWQEDVSHVPLIVVDSKKKTVVSDLISLTNMSDMLRNIVNHEKITKNIHNNIVEFQKDFLYSEGLLRHFKDTNQLYLGRAIKCWISKYDKYVLSWDGTEEYYLLEDENHNLIQDSKYAIRILEIKNIINKEFPVFKDERYSLAKIFYHYN